MMTAKSLFGCRSTLYEAIPLIQGLGSGVIAQPYEQ
jgi:hypothetical protein